MKHLHGRSLRSFYQKLRIITHWHVTTQFSAENGLFSWAQCFLLQAVSINIRQNYLVLFWAFRRSMRKDGRIPKMMTIGFIFTDQFFSSKYIFWWITSMWSPFGHNILWNGKRWIIKSNTHCGQVVSFVFLTENVSSPSAPKKNTSPRTM